MRLGSVLAALLLTASMALADSPEPDRITFAKVAQTCSETGAFGYTFGEKNAGPRDTGLAPFQIETLRGENGLYEITAKAYFGKALMSQEDRIALADWVARKLDRQIAAAHKTAVRTTAADGEVRFTFGNTLLSLGYDGVTVQLTCTDVVRQSAAFAAQNK